MYSQGGAFPVHGGLTLPRLGAGAGGVGTLRAVRARYPCARRDSGRGAPSDTAHGGDLSRDEERATGDRSRPQ